MTIASAITAAQGRVADCYTAISNKGGTLPQTQNLSNMPTAIDSIPSGGSSDIGIPREVKNGVYQMPTENFTFSLPSGTTDVGSYALYYAFYGCTGLASIDLSSLTTVSGNYGLSYAFRDCTSLTSIDLSSLTTVSGNFGLSYIFYGCTALTDIYFRALTTSSFGSSTNQFYNMMKNTGSTVTHTLHFPSNLESTIQGLAGYPLFDGTSGYVVCAFDLLATS